MELDEAKLGQSMQHEELTSLNKELIKEKDTLETMKQESEKRSSKLNERISTLKKEVENYVTEQISLKDMVKDLEINNQVFKEKYDDSVNDLKKVREGILISQMAASSMLDVEPENEDRLEDGWGSPEPERRETVSGEGKVPDEDDGLQATRGVAAHAGHEEAMAAGAWADPEPAPSLPIEAGHKILVEREADIEDGWGDDSWGGFPSQEATPLSANLRSATATRNVCIYLFKVHVFRLSEQQDPQIRGFVNDIFDLFGKPQHNIG